MHKCKDCGVNSIPKSQNYCISCRKPPWKELGFFPSVNCWKCGENKPVNADKTCEDCHKIVFKDKFRTKCGKCREDFVPTFAVQWICINCQPGCVGCGQKFSAVDNGDTLCSSCWPKRNTIGLCANCGDNTLLDHRALCINCTPHTKTGLSKCDCCGISVRTGRRICKNCLENKVTNACPRCGKLKEGKEYICNTCKITQKQSFN
jgi:hypothetical protein